MTTRIVKIGNPQGIRIPKVLLDQSGLGEEVDLAVQEAQIVIRSAECPRQGWEGPNGRAAAALVVGL
jgi:antitoxin MazE